MNRAISGALLVILSAVAIATPIAISIKLAEWQGHERELDQQRLLAAGLARRADATNLQIRRALKILSSDTNIAACSPAGMERMQDVALGSSYLKGIAYLSGNRIQCSTGGAKGNDFSLGEPNFIDPEGFRIWSAVELPMSPGMKFFVLEGDGYATISHQDLSIDSLTRPEDVFLGVYALPAHIPVLIRGNVKPEWMQRYKGEASLAFSDGHFLVAVRRSERFDFAMLSAIPISYSYDHVRNFILLFLPAGLGMGVALAFVIILLTRRHLSLNTELHTALRKKEFFMLYQPIMDLRTGQCVGAESLIRWRRIDKMPIGPDVFIRAAEQSGLIRRITGQVLDMVGQDTPPLLARHPDFHIGINFSYLDLQSAETLERVMEMTRRAGIAPRNIMVEATEHGWLNANTMRDIVRAFRDNGLRVAIDDFGTGYSSLSYLANFDLDYLKIDKSFVDTLGTDAATSHVALHIIEMSKSLKLEMIAEGVETEEQATILRERGVQYAQGWLFARPMPIADLMRFIDVHNKNAQPDPQPQAVFL